MPIASSHEIFTTILYYFHFAGEAIARLSDLPKVTEPGNSGAGWDGSPGSRDPRAQALYTT